MFGEIWTKDGKNITAGKRTRLAAAKLKDVPLDKAVKIGNGKNKVIEFTDPDCPYCRKAAAFFKGRDDVTRYVFLFPLPIHKDAEAHARYVLCAADKAHALEEVMSGQLDGKGVPACPDKRRRRSCGSTWTWAQSWGSGQPRPSGSTASMWRERTSRP